MWESEILIVERILLALVLGGIIGWEREKERKAAGLRTNMLVSLGAAAFIMVGLFSFPKSDSVARLAANIITGIGFLGAGAIIARGVSVKGLTTSAALWVSAAVGLACGIGQYFLAIFSAVVVFLVLRFGALEKKTIR